MYQWKWFTFVFEFRFLFSSSWCVLFFHLVCLPEANFTTLISCYWIYQHIIFILISNNTIVCVCVFLFASNNHLLICRNFFSSLLLLSIWLVTILTGCHFQLLVLCKMVIFFSRSICWKQNSKKNMNWNAVAHLIVSTYDKLNNPTRHISLL